LAQVGVDEGVEVAIEHRVGVADLVVGAVILHHPVRVQHVRPNLVAEADLGLALRERVHPLFLFADFELVQARLEELHRRGLVLVLRALVLTRDHDPRGQVGQAHGGVGLVDVLAAGAARPIGVDP
jgi:hypothetical protein